MNKFRIVDGELVKYHGREESVRIPDGVAMIGRGSFPPDCGVKEIILPGTVKTICAGACTGCTELEVLSVPDSVVTIGNEAFLGCVKLEEVFLGEGIESIGWSAFKGCSKLKKINCPKSLKVVKPYAFDDTALEVMPLEVQVEDGKLISYIGTRTEYTIPEDVRIIGGFAFHHNETIRHIHIPDTVVEMEKDAFSYRHTFEEIRIPGSIKRIEERTFLECGIREAFLEEGVEVIGKSAFLRCGNLEHVVIPSSIQVIGEGAFKDCRKLKRPEISEDTQIMGGAFNGCSRMADDAGFIIVRNMLFGYIGDCDVIRIPEGTVEVCDEVFLRDGKIREIFFPASVVKIGVRSLYGMRKLRHVHMAGNVSLGYECLKETEVRIISGNTALKAFRARSVKLAACAGFILAENLELSEDDQQEYIRYIQRNLLNLMDHIEEIPELLPAICKKKLMTRENAEMLILSLNDDVEKKSMLMEYINGLSAEYDEEDGWDEYEL